MGRSSRREDANLLQRSWILTAGLAIASLLFWLITGSIDQRLLSHTYATTAQLQAAGQHQIELSLNLTIVSIDAEIDCSARLTEVSVRSIGSPLEEMEFKFPLTDFEDLETALAQELGLPTSTIRQLIRYRIND